VLPGRDLVAAPGLLRRLGRMAEGRMLIEMARPAAQLGWRPVGLPLAPATLEGAIFARFAEALPAGRRAEVIVGLRPSDVLSDPRAVRRLSPLLHQRGFRLALDDATPALIALLPPERLGLDLVRLRWSPDLPSAIPEAVRRLLQAASDRMVLAGVDRPAAIAWGWEAGIRLFQGPLIERRRRGA
jgi:EAL domain-containing protein (putative c-di-GMP-specific phosphodiesterase class I)